MSDNPLRLVVNVDGTYECKLYLEQQRTLFKADQIMAMINRFHDGEEPLALRDAVDQFCGTYKASRNPNQGIER